MAKVWIGINDLDEIVSWQTPPMKDGKVVEGAVIPEGLVEVDEELFGGQEPTQMVWNDGEPVVNDKFAILEFNTERSRLMAKYEWRLIKAMDGGSTAYDAYLETEEAQEILLYKQRLRDIPTTDSGYPHNITWPPRPAI